MLELMVVIIGPYGRFVIGLVWEMEVPSGWKMIEGDFGKF
jgi:hypothetical protein